MFNFSFTILRFLPPPISTLLPYTTLFRSPQLQPQLFRGVLTRRIFAFLIDLVVLSVPVILGYLFIAVFGLITLGLDRKSTRLNSSHMSISYAVFCLKKKILLLSDFFLFP